MWRRLARALCGHARARDGAAWLRREALCWRFGCSGSPDLVPRCPGNALGCSDLVRRGRVSVVRQRSGLSKGESDVVLPRHEGGRLDGSRGLFGSK